MVATHLCCWHGIYIYSLVVANFANLIVHRIVNGILTKNIINFSQNVVQILA